MAAREDGSSAVIEAEGLGKAYGARTVLDGLSFSVGAGKIVGLLGPNGAGKTTALSILATLLRPDSGWARICGHDVARAPDLARSKLGLVPQSVALYPSLTALENLEFFARMQGLGGAGVRAAAMRVLEEVGLAERARDPVAAFSGGMKRRLNLACGMLHRPAALLLDEPTVGVDPQSRERVLAAVRNAAAGGAGILYNTNYMEEAERLCDWVVLLDRGHIVARGTPAELIALAGAEPRIEVVTQTELPQEWSRGLSGVRQLPRLAAAPGKVTLVLDSLDRVPEVLRQVRAQAGAVLEFRVQSPNLQDAFLALTGHGLRDPA